MKTKLKQISYLLLSIVSFLIMTFSNIVYLQIGSSGSIFIDASYKDYYIKGYELFFGSELSNNSGNFLAIIVCILYAILIVALVFSLIIKKKIVNTIANYISLGLSLVIFILLAFLPYHYINWLNIDNFVTLGGNRWLNYYYCSEIYYVISILLAFLIIALIFDLIKVKYSFKLDLRKVVSIITSCLFIIAFIFALVSEMQFSVNGNNYNDITPVQEFLGIRTARAIGETGLRFVFGFAYLAILLIIPLSIGLIFVNLNDKIKYLLITIQSLLGLYYGVIVVISRNLHTQKYIVGKMWIASGLLAIIVSVISLIGSVFIYIPNNE